MEWKKLRLKKSINSSKVYCKSGSVDKEYVERVVLIVAKCIVNEQIRNIIAVKIKY